MKGDIDIFECGGYLFSIFDINIVLEEEECAMIIDFTLGYEDKTNWNCGNKKKRY